jgi:tRNA-binding EMAP/Myf-like protein
VCISQGRNVVVICNLKPRNMRGVKSHGMVLCASNAAHDVVQPLVPPPGAATGERVWFGAPAASDSQQSDEAADATTAATPTCKQAAPAEPNRMQKVRKSKATLVAGVIMEASVP